MCPLEPDNEVIGSLGKGKQEWGSATPASQVTICVAALLITSTSTTSAPLEEMFSVFGDGGCHS